MPEVIFVLPDGERRAVTGVAGNSVMQTAVHNDVDGILGECGGSLACATCHVYVATPWQSLAGPPGDSEDAMLDMTVSARRPGSRLCCQIILTPELDGIEVEIAPEQA